MRRILTSAAVALALAGATVAGAGAASAAVGIGFNIGDVGVGFSDGYWDNTHHWHKWRHRADAAQFRAAHGDQYHEWRHDDPKHH